MLQPMRRVRVFCVWDSRHLLRDRLNCPPLANPASSVDQPWAPAEYPLLFPELEVLGVSMGPDDCQKTYRYLCRLLDTRRQGGIPIATLYIIAHRYRLWKHPRMSTGWIQELESLVGQVVVCYDDGPDVWDRDPAEWLHVLSHSSTLHPGTTLYSVGL